MNSTNSEQDKQPVSATAAALDAAGDSASARDIGALEAATEAVDRKLATTQKGLVERLIYGPAPGVDELRSGGRLDRRLSAQNKPVVEAALASLAAGEAFTADRRLTAAIRTAVATRQYFFDRAVTIASGTTEVQKNVIATRVLGL